MRARGGRARSTETPREPEEAVLILIAVLSLIGAGASLLVPGGVLLAPVLLGAALLAPSEPSGASRTARCASTTHR